MEKQNQTAQFYKKLYQGDVKFPSLAGYGEWHEPDIKDSISCINKLDLQTDSMIIDLGAGDGRVVKYVFFGRFDIIDVLEPDQNACDALKLQQIARNIYQMTVENFEFQQTYDCIWIQGILGHVGEDKIVGVLQRAACALRHDDKKGYMIVKEFVTDNQRVEESIGGALVRTETQFKSLFNLAGLKLIEDTIVQGPDNSEEFEKQMRWVLQKK